MISSLILWSFAAFLVILGFAGLVLPILPAGPILFAGLFAAAWADDFAFVGWRTLTLLGFMAALIYFLDFAATAFGAQRYGASGFAVTGASLGAVAGLFLGLPGVIFGPFLGAVAGELIARRDLLAAGRAGLGATMGLALGAAAKLAVAVTMVAVFIAVRF